LSFRSAIVERVVEVLPIDIEKIECVELFEKAVAEVGERTYHDCTDCGCD
jgi:hypothetical protein